MPEVTRPRSDAQVEWLAEVAVGRSNVVGFWLRRDLVAASTEALARVESFDFGQSGELVVDVDGCDEPADIVRWVTTQGVAVLKLERPAKGQWLPRLLLCTRLGPTVSGAAWRVWGRTQDGLETHLDGTGLEARSDGRFRLHGLRPATGVELYVGGPVASPRSEAILGMLGADGIMIPLDEFVELMPELETEFGWRIDSAKRLRTVWRIDDRQLARPTLGSMFVGRVQAVSDLSTFIRETECR